MVHAGQPTGASTNTDVSVPTYLNEKEEEIASFSSGSSSRSQSESGEINDGIDIALTKEGQSASKDEKDEEEKDSEDASDNAVLGDVERVVSKQPSVNNVSSIPNGGLRAWLQVLGAFFLFFNSWGIINTFGSYQAYYETSLLQDANPSAISWIGSIQAFLLMMVGALTGPIYDAGYFRELLIGGSVLVVFGQMMLSLCKNYWQVLLAQALAVGIGTGALFVPSVAILNTYFTTKIATAVGIAASGSSFGGVIYPIVFHKLVAQIGFPWTVRTIGFLILATQLIPIMVMRVRVLPAKSRSLLDLRAFLIPAYALDVFGFFVGFIGLYMPFFYSQVYAIQTGITNDNLAFYLLAIMNSTSTFGRIIPNYMADKLGPFNVVIPCTIASAVLCYCFIVAKSSAALIVVIALYGFFSGTFVSLPPTIIMHLSHDARHKIGTRLGQSFACLSIGILIGTPIGGAILDKSGFPSVWVFGGSLLVGAAVILTAARVAFKGWSLTVKA